MHKVYYIIRYTIPIDKRPVEMHDFYISLDAPREKARSIDFDPTDLAGTGLVEIAATVECSFPPKVHDVGWIIGVYERDVMQARRIRGG